MTSVIPIKVTAVGGGFYAIATITGRDGMPQELGVSDKTRVAALNRSVSMLSRGGWVGYRWQAMLGEETIGGVVPKVAEKTTKNKTRRALNG